MRNSYEYIEELTDAILRKNDSFIAGFDVNKLAKKLNVKIVKKILNPDVSGLFVMSKDIPIITYNNTESRERQRFTVAHELGHFILHSKEVPIFIDKMPKVMFRNSASSSGKLHHEREANAFAASLLMPRELVKDEIDRVSINLSNPIKTLAKTFKVSEQAMSFRLANLGYDIGLY